jgi:hypothetical protein
VVGSRGVSAVQPVSVSNVDMRSLELEVGTSIRISTYFDHALWCRVELKVETVKVRCRQWQQWTRLLLHIPPG